MKFPIEPDSQMGEFFSWLPAFGWVLIPITAIVVGGFKEWLKFRARAERQDASTEEFVRAIAALRDDRDSLARRVERLESVLITRSLGSDSTPGHASPESDGPARRTLQERTDLLDLEAPVRHEEPEGVAVRRRDRS